MSETCRICEKPMVHGPSMGGADVCCWCDCGVHRDGTPWTFREMWDFIGPHSKAAERAKATEGA